MKVIRNNQMNVEGIEEALKQALSPFTFRQNNDMLDWKYLAGIDVIMPNLAWF